MIKLLGSNLLLLLWYGTVCAQTGSMVSKQLLSSPVELCNTDRFGNIYLSHKNGNLSKRDQFGRLLAQFASQRYGKLSTLETWTSLRIFLFYQDIQQFVFLDRYLNQSEFLEFPPGQFGLVMLLAPSSDNQLWVLDSGPLTLIKYDINFGSITLSQVLNPLLKESNLQPCQLFEYQNRIYLGDSNLGILVFDNLGNYIQTIDKSGAELVYPYKEELYFLRNNNLHFVSIYSEGQRVVELPDNQVEYKHVLLTDKSLILASMNELFIYHYTPR